MAHFFPGRKGSTRANIRDRLEAFYRDELEINPDTYVPPTEEEIEEFEMEERRAWERERLVGYAE